VGAPASYEIFTGIAIPLLQKTAYFG